MIQGRKEAKKRQFSSVAGCADEQLAGGTKPSKPKRPLSAYNLFFRAKRAECIGIAREEEYKEASAAGSERSRKGAVFKNLSRNIAAMWMDLSDDERNEYEARAAGEKRRYNRELVHWRMTQMETMSRMTLTASSSDRALSSMERLENVSAEAVNLSQQERLSISPPLHPMHQTAKAAHEPNVELSDFFEQPEEKSDLAQGLSTESNCTSLASWMPLESFAKRPRKIRNSASYVGAGAKNEQKGDASIVASQCDPASSSHLLNPAHSAYRLSMVCRPQAPEPNRGLPSTFFDPTEKLIVRDFDGCGLLPPQAAPSSISPCFRGESASSDIPAAECSDAFGDACEGSGNNIIEVSSEHGGPSCGGDDEAPAAPGPARGAPSALYDPAPLGSASAMAFGADDGSFWTDPTVRSLMESLGDSIIDECGV